MRGGDDGGVRGSGRGVRQGPRGRRGGDSRPRKRHRRRCGEGQGRVMRRPERHGGVGQSWLRAVDCRANWMFVDIGKWKNPLDWKLFSQYLIVSSIEAVVIVLSETCYARAKDSLDLQKMIQVIAICFCSIFWRKKKLQNNDLQKFLEKRSSEEAGPSYSANTAEQIQDQYTPDVKSTCQISTNPVYFVMLRRSSTLPQKEEYLMETMHRDTAQVHKAAEDSTCFAEFEGTLEWKMLSYRNDFYKSLISANNTTSSLPLCPNAPLEDVRDNLLNNIQIHDYVKNGIICRMLQIEKHYFTSSAERN
uniref:Uncharacterized protein n=1 Tax=Oryza brachyantha TaxID=4533 RepID=J3LW29_ORYBR